MKVYTAVLRTMNDLGQYLYLAYSIERYGTSRISVYQKKKLPIDKQHKSGLKENQV
jgi:hypothetical protein